MFFEQAGQPYDGPVDFTITCSGYRFRPGPLATLAPGSYTPEPVYTFLGTCAGYGCEVDHDLYLNYRVIDRCDLEGTTGGVRFAVKNYASRPIDLAACSGPTGPEGRSNCELHVAIPEDVPLPAAASAVPAPAAGTQTMSFLLAVLVTLAVELPVLWLLARFVFRLTRVSTRRLFAVGVLASVVTLPLLWFVLPRLLPAQPALVVGEGLVVVLEALCYWRLLPSRLGAAIGLAVIANVASFLVGVVVF